MAPPPSRLATPIFAGRHWHRQPLFPSIHPDGVLRQRLLGVPDEQPVRGGGGEHMGQWRRLRPPVPGAVHQRAGAAVVRAGPDHPDQNRRPGPDLLIPPLPRGIQHRALRHRLPDHRQPRRALLERRVSTVSAHAISRELYRTYFYFFLSWPPHSVHTE